MFKILMSKAGVLSIGSSVKTKRRQNLVELLPKAGYSKPAACGYIVKHSEFYSSLKAICVSLIYLKVKKTFSNRMRSKYMALDSEEKETMCIINEIYTKGNNRGIPTLV